jgi:hypothetical protein
MRIYNLPDLTTFIRYIKAPAGLDYLHLFLNPKPQKLQNLTLEIILLRFVLLRASHAFPSSQHLICISP